MILLVIRHRDNHCSGAIASKFRGCGQACIAANRIYVHSSVYAEFASRLAEKVAAFKAGDGLLDDRCVLPPTTCLNDAEGLAVTVPTGL